MLVWTVQSWSKVAVVPSGAQRGAATRSPWWGFGHQQGRSGQNMQSVKGTVHRSVTGPPGLIRCGLVSALKMRPDQGHGRAVFKACAGNCGKPLQDESWLISSFLSFLFYVLKVCCWVDQGP